MRRSRPWAGAVPITEQGLFQEDMDTWAGNSLKGTSSAALSHQIPQEQLQRWPKWHKIIRWRERSTAHVGVSLPLWGGILHNLPIILPFLWEKNSSLPFMSAQGRIKKSRLHYSNTLLKMPWEVCYAHLGEGTSSPKRHIKVSWTFLRSCEGSIHSLLQFLQPFQNWAQTVPPPAAALGWCWSSDLTFPLPSHRSWYHMCTHRKCTALLTYIALKIKRII